MRTWTSAFVCLALLLPLAACKKTPPKVGDKCTAGQGYCNPDGILACSGKGKLEVTQCRGPKGCEQTTPTTIQCDNSVAAVGEKCQMGEISCAADKKSVLQCGALLKWEMQAACKGPRGCELKDDAFFCDAKVASVDDACDKEGNYACAEDKKSILRCDESKFRTVATCRGEDGCNAKEVPDTKRIEFWCDDWQADEGDPCERTDQHACSLDKKTLYVCVDNKFAKQKPCTGPGGCSVNKTEHKLSCDTGKGQVASVAAGVSRSSSATPAPKGATTDAGAKPAASAKPADSAAAKGVDAGAKAAPSASAKPGTTPTSTAKPTATTPPKPTASARR
jgi:hypothetical protein